MLLAMLKVKKSVILYLKNEAASFLKEKIQKAIILGF